MTARLRRDGLRLAPGLTVGLYGGAFDPPHAGHRHVARTALRRLRLDRLIWLTAPRSPLKPAGPRDELATRLAAVRRVARGPREIASAIEARLGAHYTVETIEALRRRFPAVRFVWVMGADGLAQFHRWRDWRRLARLIPIAVVSRPGVGPRGRLSALTRRFPAARLPSAAAAMLARHRPPAWVFLEAPLHPHSSSAIRSGARADAGRPNVIDCETDTSAAGALL